MTTTTETTSVALDAFADYANLVAGTTYLWSVTAADSAQAVSAPSLSGRFVYNVATLTVTANMPDADVYVIGNHGYPGQWLGTTPLELTGLAASTFTMVVERAGFEPYVTLVSFDGTSSKTVYAQLVPARKPTGFRTVTDSINGKTGLTVGGNAASFVVDYNNDGKLDLLTGDGAGQVKLFPSITFASSSKFTVGAGQSLVQVSASAVPFVADWNNDGRKDLLVGQADGTVRLFLNNGTDAAPVFDAGQFLQIAGVPADFGSNAAPVVIDLNLDGLKDLVVGNSAGQVVFCRNQGSDDAPQLAAATALFTVTGAAVPA
jgi:hypothetical protein